MEAHRRERTTSKRWTKLSASTPTCRTSKSSRILQMPRYPQVWPKWQMEIATKVPAKLTTDTWVYLRMDNSKPRTRWARPRAMLLARPRLRRLYHISWSSKRETWAMTQLTQSVKVQPIRNSYIEWEPQLIRLLETIKISLAATRCKSSLVKPPRHLPSLAPLTTYPCSWPTCNREVFRSSLTPSKCRSLSIRISKIHYISWWTL